MKGKKKNIIKVIIVLLLIGGVFYLRNRGLYIIRGLLSGRMKDYVKVCKAEVIGIRHEGER